MATKRQEARVRAALRAARLYYVQDMKMESVAEDLGVSRSSVSRLLQFARDTGLVDIRVNSPFERAGLVEDQLRDRFKVAAHVVPMSESTTDVERMERVAITAGRLVPEFIESNMVVGVAWGSTVATLSRVLMPKDTSGTTIVQLNGAGNTRTSGVEYSSEILGRFGKAYSAQVEQFPVPTFFDDPSTREAMWRERSTKWILSLRSKMDLAIFSIGSPSAEVPSRVHAGGYLNHNDYESLRKDGVVGDVATVFFRADGSWKDIELNARATGIELDRLRRVPRRLCVVTGKAKLQGTLAVLAAGLATDIVLDEMLARQLLEL